MQIKTNFEIHPVKNFEFKDLPTEIKDKVNSGEYKGYLGRTISILGDYLEIDGPGGKGKWTPQVEVITSQEEVWFLV